MAVCTFSLRPPAVSSAYRGTAAKDGTGKKVLLRASYVVAGVVAGLFGSLYAVFLLLEYVVGPVVRILAS